MQIVASILIGLVALEHFYILVLEMFLWTTPHGRKAFGMTPEQAEATRALAANQGLYNGFLGAGLVWALIYPDQSVGRDIALFFLLCVLVAAVYGAATARRSILLVQGGPAGLALAFVLIAHFM